MALLKTDKMFGERKNEQPRSHAFLPHEQVQNAKNREWYCRFQCSRVKKQSPLHNGLPQYCRPLAATGASKKGSFVVRTNRHGCARFLLARLGIGEASCK
jgi:hypothetical protein